MPKCHATYPEAVRADAVTLVRRRGKSLAAVAEALGVSGESLRTEVQQAKIGAAQGSTGAHTTEEHAE